METFKNEFVTYEQAKALYELGFDDLCLYAYDGYNLRDANLPFVLGFAPLLAPLKQQALRWFRQNCKDIFYIKMSGSYSYYINLNQKLIGDFYTYTEAENFLINELLNISNHGQSNT